MGTSVITVAEWAEARRLFEQEGWTAVMLGDYLGMSSHSIYARVRREGWKRCEQPATKRRAIIQELAEQQVAEEVAAQLGEAREDAILEANAQEVSRVMLLHRSGATKMRELVGRMFNELQLACVPEEDMMRLIELVAAEEPTPRAEAKTIAAFRQLLGLDARADTAKKLVDSMIKVVDLERRVYGIRDEVTEGDVARALKELAAQYE